MPYQVGAGVQGFGMSHTDLPLRCYRCANGVRARRPAAEFNNLANCASFHRNHGDISRFKEK
jgi:hypothetical protein